MAVHHHKAPIVTDGLIFYVDANNKLGGNVSDTKNIVIPSEVGTFVNGTTVTNGEYVFDGVDNNIDFGNIHDFDGSTPFSYGCWYNANSLGVTFILAKYDWNSYYGYNIYFASGFMYYIIGQDVTNTIQLRTSSSVSTGEWIDVMITYDGSKTASGTKLYFNGVEQATTVIIDNFIGSSSNTNSLKVGSTSDNLGFFNGNVSNVKIYNKELTPTEIKQNYEAQKHRFE